MPSIIVYGLHTYSNPTRTVLITAKLLGLDVDYRLIDLFERDQLKPEYKKLNPQHTIPTLDDNGTVIWDSHAICTYLIDKYGKEDSLYSKDLYTRAKIDQRMYFECGVLFPALRRNFSPVYFLGENDFSDNAREEVTNAFNLLESFFTDDLFLVGNTLTIADISCVPTVTQLEFILPVDGTKYPKIRAWLDRIAKLPYFEELNTKPLAELKEDMPKYIAKGKTTVHRATISKF